MQSATRGDVTSGAEVSRTDPTLSESPNLKLCKANQQRWRHRGISRLLSSSQQLRTEWLATRTRRQLSDKCYIRSSEGYSQSVVLWQSPSVLATCSQFASYELQTRVRESLIVRDNQLYLQCVIQGDLYSSRFISTWSQVKIVVRDFVVGFLSVETCNIVIINCSRYL